jgi:hypothetical protein
VSATARWCAIRAHNGTAWSVRFSPQGDQLFIARAMARRASGVPGKRTEDTRHVCWDPRVDLCVQRALAAIAAAEQAVANTPPTTVSLEYSQLIQATEALPENQDGADKGWVWPAFEFCRRHFANASSQHRM